MNTELLCWLDYDIHYFIASVFQGSLFLTYSASAWHLHLPTARLRLLTACQIYARANKRFAVEPVEVKITSIRVHFAAGDQEHGVILLVALQQQWLYFLWRLRAWSDSIWLHSVLHALNTITEARAWSKVYVSEEWRVIINWLSIPFKNARLDIWVLFYENTFFGVSQFTSITKDQTPAAIENPVLFLFVLSRWGVPNERLKGL